LNILDAFGKGLARNRPLKAGVEAKMVSQFLIVAGSVPLAGLLVGATESTPEAVVLAHDGQKFPPARQSGARGYR